MPKFHCSLFIPALPPLPSLPPAPLFPPHLLYCYLPVNFAGRILGAEPLLSQHPPLLLQRSSFSSPAMIFSSTIGGRKPCPHHHLVAVQGQHGGRVARRWWARGGGRQASSCLPAAAAAFHGWTPVAKPCSLMELQQRHSPGSLHRLFWLSSALTLLQSSNVCS